MINIAICDDEEYFRRLIHSYVADYLRNRAVSCEVRLFDSGKSFLELGTDILKYHIVFLDINMADMDGIETAKLIRKISRKIYLVFVTAYMDYTLEGYKVDAVRYLLKKPGSLRESMTECMDAVFDKMNYADLKMKFRFKEGEREISLERLIYIESRLHKLEFHIIEDCSKVYTLYEKLDVIEKQLQKHLFIRIHQSYLVNMRYIKNMKRYQVLLTNGQEFPIPRIRYADVFDAYTVFKGEF